MSGSLPRRRWRPLSSERTISVCSDSGETQLAAIIQHHLQDYKYSQLKVREAKLVGKLEQVRQQLREQHRPEPDTISLSSLRHPGLASHMASSQSLSSLASCQEPEPVFLFPELDINTQDARIREKCIIEFETTQQAEKESLEDFVTRLQHDVVAAYGSEGTEILQRRVAWAFIRGVRDHTVRSFVVAQGWTKTPTETLSPAELLDLANMSPVVKCEGMLKRKITHAPAEVKCEKSWTPLFTVLKANTLFFYKDSKHYRRNEPESACELTETAQILSEHDRKGFKLIKIQKDNGLEMLLKVKDEAGTRSSSFDSWLEQLTSSAGGPTQGMRSSHSTSHLENMDYDGDVDIRSIIGNKEITKKDINEFLKRRETANQLNKSCIQQMLDEQGIDISHLDKSKKKEVLNKLLSARPSVGDLEKRGLIKYTVFQCPLAKLCSRQKVQVPKVVTQCIEAIEHRGLKSSGIYRINGNNASITKLRYKVDREEAVNLKDQEYDINILTGFMKLFLRELPEPVIPWNQYPIVERAIRDGDAGIGDPVTAIKQVVQNLPEPNKSTLIYIILHLVRVANEENQMDEHNLSIIFGPSLLGNHPERRNLLADLPVQNKAIELIISNYKTIFTFR